MADKTSTIILKVDLECRRCYKKISKAICQVQEKVNIQEIVFNEKTNTVTISGPFDPKKVCQKLCCKACNVIKEIEIKDGKEKSKEAPKPDKSKEASKTDKPNDNGKPVKSAEPTNDKPKDAKPAEPTKDKPKDAKPAEPKNDKPKDAKPTEPAEGKKDKPKEDKPKDAKPVEPAEAKKVKFVEPETGKDAPKALEWGRSEPMYFDQPVQGYQPVWARPACGCQGYYGNSAYCGCSAGYGGVGGYGWCQPGPSQVVYGKPVYDGYNNGSHNYFCEEDPQSCSIM